MTIPSQGQLYRQATDKEALATTLTRYAEELDRVFAGTLARPQDAHAFWKGPAADRFATQAAQLRREVGGLIENCRSTAQRLRNQAQLLRNEAAQLPG
ncbi:hypothetical protein [Nonomuraea sp. KM88]|uniref:hypothetical protein n=1 Tax=Nonomuraea sp. KM88 TaxID=3457427 RepID=UPI003FCC3092